MSYALDFAKERVDVTQLDELDIWLALSEWILQQPPLDDAEGASPEPLRNEWDLARRSVVDLVEACLKTDAKVPADRRDALFGLLKAVCLGLGQAPWILAER